VVIGLSSLVPILFPLLCWLGLLCYVVVPLLSALSFTLLASLRALPHPPSHPLFFFTVHSTINHPVFLRCHLASHVVSSTGSFLFLSPFLAFCPACCAFTILPYDHDKLDEHLICGTKLLSLRMIITMCICVSQLPPSPVMSFFLIDSLYFGSRL
jgi:hypothetical protein